MDQTATTLSKGEQDGIRVFIADDHKIVRDGLRMILELEKDMSVIGEAGDGAETVRSAGKLRPDVIVMDIGMPGLNGIEATRIIRESNQAIQVVILSMYASTEHIYQALSAGALGYVLKEAAGAEVVKAIRVVNMKRRYTSEKVAEAIADDFIARRRSSTKSPLERLNLREREILQLVVEGKSSKEIANKVHMSFRSVDTYRWRIMQKLGIHDVPGLVKFAMEHCVTAGAKAVARLSRGDHGVSGA